MGCSCGSTKDGQVSGCKNNGACNTGGCNKMNVFDWLSNMDMPMQDKFDVVEVRFKNGRKEVFRNSEKINLTTGDAIVVEVPSGHHIGHVSMQGELVRLQMQKKKIANDGEIKKIYRLAHQKDLEKFEEVKKRELPTLYRTREILRDLKLPMKLSDIEYQADNTKATFFYSADDRVDFRELIKILAGDFKIRVEMRQISLRQEAGRLGGIGVCGRELCCSTWLTDFKNVATSAARYQNLSLNPSKLSGQCGRLKCCLNYELETYMDALESIPKIEHPLLTEKGEATLQKTDIFRKIMWFGFREENTWYPLNVDRVNEILKLNAEGKKPANLTLDVLQEKVSIQTLNSDLDRMDKKFKNKPKGSGHNAGGESRNQGTGNRNQRTDNRNQGTGNKDQGAENRNPRTGNRNQGTDNKNQGEENRNPRTGNRNQRPENKDQRAGNRNQGGENRNQGGENKNPGTGNNNLGAGGGNTNQRNNNPNNRRRPDNRGNQDNQNPKPDPKP